MNIENSYEKCEKNFQWGFSAWRRKDLEKYKSSIWNVIKEGINELEWLTFIQEAINYRGFLQDFVFV